MSMMRLETKLVKVSEIKYGDIKTEYRYDTDGRKSVLKVTVGKNVISDIKYDYDESGNCIKKANIAGGINAVTEYGYDGMGRLTTVNSPDTVETYAYDNAGNRISRTINGEIKEKYCYNELNELLSIESPTKDNSDNKARNFTYDADGNMTSDGRGIYKYDSLNRMSEAVMEDGRKLICRYDAEGLRHETEENGRLIRFIYSGREAVCEEADDNITRYIRGNGRLIASDSENARTYYHYACDSLGSITHVILGNEFGNGGTNGGVSRRILCRYGYDAFGNTISGEETAANRYGFTGEMHDCITGMYYLRARYYCTDAGRFTQEDIYHGDGLNLYVYAGNNPVKYVDPSGHVCKDNDPDGVGECGSEPRNILNVGAGYNPIPCAINIDIIPSSEGVIFGDANDLSEYASGQFDHVIALNPYKYFILDSDVPRVLKEGGIMSVTGNYSNKYFKSVYNASPEVLSQAGFEVVSRGEATSAFLKYGGKVTGGARQTQGKTLQIILRKVGA